MLRLDVEDWLTPAADWALEHIVRLLEDYGIRANAAVVGLKAQTLQSRGRASLLHRIAAVGTPGYHSWSHSHHPTLAEALEPLGRAEALRIFTEREGQGVRLLSDLGFAPRFFTQPGGNWIPEVTEVGPDMGLMAFVSESWNSYLRPSREPWWLDRAMYLAPPVDMPRGFLFQLPAGVDAAVEQVKKVWASGQRAMLVTHPTELVTVRFWDADNFAKGRTRYPLEPGQARPAAEWNQAMRGLHQYFEALLELDPTWVTVDDLLSAAMPPAPTPVYREDLARALASYGLGPMTLPTGTLSAAEALWAMAAMVAGVEEPVFVPRVGAPEGHLAAHIGGTLELAETVLRAVTAHGHLPSSVRDWDVREMAGRFARALHLGDPPLTFWYWVRDPKDVHWDWPIFPEGFRAYRLWAEACRHAWTLKPVMWRRNLVAAQ